MSAAPISGALRAAARPAWKRAALRLALTISVLGMLVLWLPRDQLRATLAALSPVAWALTVLGFLGCHAVAALKWRLLLRASGVPLGIRRAMQAHGAGLLANVWMPALVGGDVVRAGLAIQNQGRAAAVAVGSLADRLLDTGALLLVALGGAWLAPGVLDLFAERALAVAAGAIGAALVLGAALRASRLRLPERLRPPLERAGVALTALLERPTPGLVALSLSLGIQSSLVLLNASLAAAMGMHLPLAVWFLAWPLAKLVALAPISFGGIGVREAAIAALLAPFGVPAAQAVGQSIAWEVVMLTGGLCAGIGSFGLGRFASSGESR